ncbi:MAG: hypothetical protein ABRQ25_07490 [Clostridiaceae bacterium]
MRETLKESCKKEAIIVIPGIMGSTLKNSQSNKVVWITGKGAFGLEELIYLLDGELSCNGVGESVKPIEPVTGEEEYGANESYKILITRLKGQFSQSCEIIFFAYDWRLDNDAGAVKLKEQIDRFDKVRIVAHSMGGLVTAKYISSYENSKIQSVVTLGTPYLGSIDAFQYLYTGKFKSMPKNVGGVIKGFSAALISKDIRRLLLNYPSIYQLVPTSEYTENNQWLLLAQEKPIHWYNHFWEDSNSKTADIEETKQFLKTSFNEGLVEAAERFHSALKELSSLIKDMQYKLIVGTGVETVRSLKIIDTNTLSGKLRAIDLEYSNEGDGVVQAFSGAANDLENNNVIKIYGESHRGLAEDDVTLRLVESIIKGEDISGFKDERESDIKKKFIKFVFAGDAELEAFNQDREIFNVKKILNEEFQGYNMRGETRFNMRIAGKIENENIFVGTGELGEYTIKIKSLKEQNTDFSIGSEEFLYKYDRINLKQGSVLHVNVETGGLISLELNKAVDL